MAKRILVAGPYIGELGHEIGEWVPHVYGKFVAGKFDEVHVFTRGDRNGLYPFAARIVSIDFPFNRQTDSHWMINPHGEAMTRAAEITRDVRNYVNELRQQGTEVLADVLCLARRKELFADKQPVFLPASGQLISSWAKRLPGGKKILLAYRAYHRGSRKNTPAGQLKEVATELKRRNYVPVVIGQTDPDFPPLDIDCVNLVNSTSISDLLALYHLSHMIIGCTTGTMHLAAFCKQPFIVWGGGWEPVKERYDHTWNPFDVWHIYISLEWQVTTQDIIKAIQQAETKQVL